MPLILRGHVDYGNGPGPKPRVIAAPEPPVIKYRHIPKEYGTPDAVFFWLMTFIESGERAPSRDQIIVKFGNRGLGVVADLVSVGRISVEMFAGNYRVIIIDGRRTKASAEHLQPCMLRNKAGVFQRVENGWEKVG